MALLHEWRKKSTFVAAALAECESLPECASLNLAAFLLEPVQRIPRFKLLLTGTGGDASGARGDKSFRRAGRQSKESRQRERLV